MPFFFDLSSLLPTVERNPFAPVEVHDEVPAEPGPEEIPAEPLVDTGLPIPSHYSVDLMRALVQDPFHLFVHWQLKDNPYDRLRRVFPGPEVETFHSVLKLIDETNQIAVFFDAAFAREYWFTVFPDRAYRVELGLRSPRYGYIKLLSSQPVRTPRGAPSDQTAEEPGYRIAADEFVRVLRESHLVPERAFAADGLLPLRGATPEARAEFWSALPSQFRRLLEIIAAIQAGSDYEKLWEQLSQEEVTVMVRDFLATLSRMGNGELGYMLLLRYLPELLRRAIAVEGAIEVDKPISLYLAERLGLAASELSPPPPPAPGEARRGLSDEPWLPSLTS